MIKTIIYFLMGCVGLLIGLIIGLSAGLVVTGLMCAIDFILTGTYSITVEMFRCVTGALGLIGAIAGTVICILSVKEE